MDVVQGVSSVSAGAASLGDWLGLHWKELATYTGLVLLGWFIVSKVGKRVWSTLEETMLSNWRLALLAATGIVLSLASGWTTWDGMRNFTKEPLLSLMITFGIQGVMLIVAWLIGESFATGMSQQTATSRRGINKGVQAVLGGATGILLFLAVLAIILQSSGQIDFRATSAADLSWSKFGDKLLIAAVGLLIMALVVVYATSDIIKPYLQGSRVILKNAVLWVMFLACMTTSVFFSFDSLFSAIFPQSERVRAADLRAQNQVAGIVADIDQTIEKRSIQESEALFTSAGWQAYDAHLTKLANAAQGAQAEIERYFSEQVEARNRTVKEQQERIATAQGSEAGLAAKKVSLTEERSLLAAERPGLAAVYAQKKSELDSQSREIDAKRVDASAESKGVEGTGKVGRGPMYRERMAELEKLQAAYKIAEERANNAQKRLTTVESRLAQIDRELAAIHGDLATYHAEAQTAEQRIQLAQGSGEAEEGPRLDPARILTGFEKAKAEFRQKPDVAHLTNLHQQCSQLLGAMASTEVTKAKIGGIDCDPKQASEAAAVMFALNTGSRAFGANCAGGERLEANKGADQLFGFARKCLSDSGLPSKETDELRTNINTAELNRDDKAHRFVVTWNAFEDGNRLAYLALGIAVAIDTLVFMSGLFGANAVRSPLSDVPSYKARTAQQLEAIIENALLPDTFETAQLTLHALRPITNVSGFMAEVRPDQLDSHSAGRVLAVLNAGATIHAVEYDEQARRYLVRSELFEFLSVVAKRAFEASEHHVNLAELEKIVGVALLPDLSQNAETVLQYMHPISEDRGFTAEIKLNEVAPEHLRTVRSTLNAGATLDRVQRAGKDASHYFVHRDLYKTLALIRARTLMTGYRQPQIAATPQGQRYGGSLSDQVPAIAPTKALPRSDTAGGHDGISDFEADVLDHFAMELGHQTEELERLLRVGQDVDVPGIAGTLNSVLRNDRNMAGQMTKAHQALGESIDSARESFPGAKLSDGAQVRTLNDIANELNRMRTLILLGPQGAYRNLLARMRDELRNDENAGRLTEADAKRYEFVEAHVRELETADLDSKEGWDDVLNSLKSFNYWLSSTASTDQDQPPAGPV